MTKRLEAPGARGRAAHEGRREGGHACGSPSAPPRAASSPRAARSRARCTSSRPAALDDFPRSVDAYRDKSLARFVPSEARRFELAFHGEGAGESLRRDRDARGRGLEDGARGARRAEGRRRSCASSRASTAPTIAAESMGAAERAKLGLEPPRALLRVFGGPEEGADAPLAEVQLGALDAKRGIAARRSDREIVYFVAAERAEELPVSLEALRARFLAKPGAGRGRGRRGGRSRGGRRGSERRGARRAARRRSAGALIGGPRPRAAPPGGLPLEQLDAARTSTGASRSSAPSS